MVKKRITAEQETGNTGQFQVAMMFLTHGWQPRSLTPDLGEDFIVDIYDEGISAGLAFYVQVKSSEHTDEFKLKDGNFSYPIEVKDLEHWQDYKPPVILLLWDAIALRGYWVMIDEVIRKLKGSSPAWQQRKTVKVHLPQANTTELNSLKRLRHALATLALPSLMADNQMSITLNFSFPDNEQGRSEQEAMRQFFAAGEGVTVSGQFLSGIYLPDWYERKFGRPEISPTGKIVFGPRRSEQIEKIRLTLLSSEKRVEQVQVIEMKAVRVGNEKMTLSNEHLPTPFLCHIVLESTGHYGVELSLSGARSTAAEALRAYQFFDKANRGGWLRVETLTQPEQWNDWRRVELAVPKNKFQGLSSPFRTLLEKLSLIEQKLGVVFELGDDGVGEKDWRQIHRVAQIIDVGRLQRRFQREDWKVTIDDVGGQRALEALLEAHKKKESFSVNVNAKEAQVEILGVDISLGPYRSHITTFLEDECARELMALQNSNQSPSGIHLTVVNGEVTEEFLDWLPTPPELKELSKPED